MCEQGVKQKTRVLDVIDEAPGIKTLVLEGTLEAQPGQFVMLYLTGKGERPFSIYWADRKKFAVTIADVGEVSNNLVSLKKGDWLSVMGPRGKPFALKGKHIALVGGGYGSAPLTFLAKKASEMGIVSELIIGAKTKKMLLYQHEKMPKNVTRHYCTDDGSFGFKGFVTEQLRELLSGDGLIDMVYTVGPEFMMKAVVDICDEFKKDCQLSLERYMKCGFGICGSCAVDPLGIRMCVEGPCIDKALAKKITEFGKYHRDASGKKITL